MAKEKKNQFIVMNMKDVANMSERGRAALQMAAEEMKKARVVNGQNPHPHYFVCNQDEPYAKEVLGVILKGEDVKALNAKAKGSIKDDQEQNSCRDSARDNNPETGS